MRLLCLVTGVLVLASPVFGGDQRGKHGGAEPSRVTGVHGTVQIVFSRQDVLLIREHYASQRRSLPPGLQKKLARTGTLPPGWQKKLQPLPVGLEQKLVVLPDGYRRGVIDGQAVIYRPGGVVVDATVVF